MNPIHIRAFRPEDFDSVNAIASEPAAASAPRWTESQYRKTLVSPDRETLIAESQRLVVGFAIVHHVPAEAELENIVVATANRGRGIGAALMKAAFDAAARKRATQIFLEVRASNADAIRLYRAGGFTETGRRNAYYLDPEEDAVLMSKTLTPRS